MCEDAVVSLAIGIGDILRVEVMKLMMMCVVNDLRNDNLVIEIADSTRVKSLIRLNASRLLLRQAVVPLADLQSLGHPLV